MSDKELPVIEKPDSSLTAAIKEKIGEWRKRGDLCRHSSRALKAERGKAYLELAAELEQLVSRQSDWRDISTAPKDGTDFLGYWHDHDELHVVSIRSGYCRRAMDHDFWMMPTHWMPLPASPVAQEGQDSE